MASFVYAGAARYLGDGRGGLFRLAIGRGTWEPLDGGLPRESEVRSVVIHPDDPAEIWAGTQDGPYRSRDHGEHWELLPLPDADRVVWSFLFDPRDAEVLYVGTAPPAIYRSTNRGASWEALPIVPTAGLIEGGFPTRVIRLTVDPQNPGEVYAGLEVGGVMRSRDGGDTWEDCTADLLRLAGQAHLKSAIISDDDTEGMMDSHALAVSASRSRTIFLANRMGLFRSDDGADTWREMEIGRFSPLTYARDVRVSPHDSQTLFAALSKAAVSNEGSLYISRDLGETWERFDHGIDVHTTLMSVCQSVQDPARIFCGGRGGQVLGTTDGGATWNEFPMPEGVEDVYTLACN
ncbi:MAG: hypothetical protein P8Y95_08195 [Gammaproteobacteria bacterium]|jgi:photosystem II stability/assembly factor-like uncharacterized protein